MLTCLFLSMRRYTRLTNEDRIRIDALRHLGKSSLQTSRELNISKSTVASVVKKQSTNVPKKKPGRKPTPSERDKRRLINMASNSTRTARGFAADCGFSVSKWTVARVLKSSDHIASQKMKSAPRLTQSHREKRLLFARNEMNKDWKKVIFSDEKKFNGDGPDLNHSYWRDLRKEPLLMSRGNFGGFSLMVWGAFCSDGTVGIQFTSCKVKSQDYQSLPGKTLVPFTNNTNKNYVFMQDSASIHATRSTLSYLQSNNIPLLSWPACSPDINPIENIWDVLVRKIYANGRVYDNVKSLRRAITMEWKSLLKKLCDSMPDRIFELTRKKGGCTHY
ncbi:hypothetical protein V3C99_007766 [Haemonchus contortus]